MADPLSLAGTAVGIVSLGIQVCQGLYNYASAVRGRDQDLDAASTKIHNLRQSFQDIDDLIKRIRSLPNSSAAAIQTLEKCLRNSEQGVKQLRSLLTSLEDVPDSSFKAKVKSAGRTLAFGLRQEDLVRIQENVDSLLIITQNALQVVNSHLGISLRRELSDCKTSFNSQQANTSHQLQIIDRRLEETGGQVKSTSALIETKSNAILATIQTARQDLQDSTNIIVSQSHGFNEDLRRMLNEHRDQIRQDFAQSIAISAGAQFRIHSEHSGYDAHQIGPTLSLPYTGHQLLSKPSLMKEVCDSVNYPQSESNVQALITPLCTCNIQKIRTSKSFSSLCLSKYLKIYGNRHRSSRHSQSCRFYSPAQSQHVGVQFATLLYGGLSLLVDISLSHKSGAGGFSISPHVAFKPTVETSPAISLIHQQLCNFVYPYLHPNSLLKSYEKRFSHIETEILTLFQEGKASPQEVNIRGETLLHTLCEKLNYHIFFNSKLDLTEHICRLINVLISAGVPRDEVSVHGRKTFLDSLCLLPIHIDSNITFSARTISANVSNFLDAEPFVKVQEESLKFLDLFLGNEKLINSTDLHPLLAAILLRSEPKVRERLNKNTNVIFEKYFGMSVLHLTSSWPSGLSLFIKAGASMLLSQGDDDMGLTPLDYALHFQCPEAVELILDHGGIYKNYHLLDEEMPPECAQCLAFHLANRRRSLCSIVIHTLPENQTNHLQEHDEAVLDTQALFFLQQVLKIVEYVPKTLQVPDNYEGIYFEPWLTLGHFRWFFKAGFRDLNKKNLQGILPIHFIGRTRTFISSDDFLWLKSHLKLDEMSTDPLLLGLNTSATGWHYMALHLLYMGFGFPRYPNIFQESIPVIAEVFKDESRDCCNCWCCPGGCLPFTKFLTAFSNIQVDKGYDQIKRLRLNNLHLHSEFLRCLTFEALEMTHTCCHLDFIPSPNIGTNRQVLKLFAGNEIEIQEEEQHLGARLDGLVEEFKTQMEKSGQSLGDFVYSYWATRMAEECIPSLDNVDELRCADPGIQVAWDYETPLYIRYILGWDFNFRHYLLTSDVGSGLGHRS